MALFDVIAPSYLQTEWPRLSTVRSLRDDDQLPHLSSSAEVEKSFFSTLTDQDAYELTLAALDSTSGGDIRLHEFDVIGRQHDAGPKFDTKRPRKELEVRTNSPMALPGYMGNA